MSAEVEAVYTPGEIVAFVVEGCRVLWQHHGTIRVRAGDRLFYTVPIGEGVTIVRQVPVEGEPRPGEVWQDRTCRPFWVVTHQGSVQLRDIRGHSWDWRKTHAEHGLVRLFTAPSTVDGGR